MDNEQQWQNKKGHSLFLIEKFMGVLFFLSFCDNLASGFIPSTLSSLPMTWQATPYHSLR